MDAKLEAYKTLYKDLQKIQDSAEASKAEERLRNKLSASPDSTNKWEHYSKYIDNILYSLGCEIADLRMSMNIN